MTLRLLFILYIFLLSGCASLDQDNHNKAVKPRIPELNILFAGDVMLDWGIQDTIIEKGINYPLKDLKDFLHTFDYRFCNLECPIAENGEVHPEKKYVFLGRPKHTDLLKIAGINGVSLANNHACDYGKNALLYTVNYLIKNRISIAGAGENIEAAHIPATISKNNIKAAILAYTSIAYDDSFADDDTPGVARARIDLIKNDIAQFKNLYEFIIISIHWGEEYSEYPNQLQIDLAHSIIESGADAIFGHHPHIPQGIEIYNNKPIFYSLGNFIFGSINENIKNNILVQISFLKDKIKLFRVFPINTNNTKHPFQYRLLRGKDAEASLNHLLNISEPLQSEFTDNAVIEGQSIAYFF